MQRRKFRDNVSLADDQGMEAISNIVREMRMRVTRATNGLTCSAGIAATRMLAKVGSDINKPDGQHVLRSSKKSVVSFVRSLKIRKIPGIGRVTEKLLQGIGVSTVADMWERRNELKVLFREKSSSFFLRVALGVTSCSRGEEKEDDDDVGRKSFSIERTFGDISEEGALLTKLKNLCDSLSDHARKKRLVGNTLTLKLKTTKFDILNRSQSLVRRVGQDGRELYLHAEPLLRAEFPITVRLMGVRLSNLTSIDDVPQSSNAPPERHRQAMLKEFADSDSPGGTACPICGARISPNPGQTANAALNVHIDSCLNRQWIRENVRRQTGEQRNDVGKPNAKRRKKGAILQYFQKS